MKSLAETKSTSSHLKRRNGTQDRPVPGSSVRAASSPHKQIDSAKKQPTEAQRQRGEIIRQDGEIQKRFDEIQELRERLELERQELEGERQTLAEAYQKLEASHDRYVDLYDFAPVGYLTLSRSGCIVHANLTARKLLGRERQNLVGRPLMPLVAQSDRRAFLKHLARVATTEQEATIELWFPHQNGQRIFLQFISLRGFETSAGTFRIRTAITDITARKQAEEALREARDHLEVRVRERTAELTQVNATLEAEIDVRKRAELERTQLAAIVKSSSDAILSKTLDGIITSWNQAAERMFGYVAGDIVGHSVSMLIPADRDDELKKIIEHLKSAQAVDSMETVRVRKDGSLVDISLTLSPIKDNTGEVTGASAIMRDISEQKWTAKALRESEARLQAILDNSPSLIFLKDPDGRYLHVNRQFGQIFNLTLEQTLGKTDAEIFPSKHAVDYRANDLKVLQAGVPLTFDEVAVHADGLHTNIVTKFPLHDLDGKIYAIGGIVTDITERQRLEAEVLKISDREQRRIAQDLHDGLGQQLTGVWCLSEVLRKNLEAQTSPETVNAIKISKLLNIAVNQTRTLARGLYPVPIEQNGLMSALEELASSITELFKLCCYFKCQSPVLIKDNSVATHLYRVAQEAVMNAIKHGRAERIEIGLSSCSGQVILSVRDDGLGLRKIAGPPKGLGLRTMNYRANLMGGTLVIQSRTKGGTEVVCTVPQSGMKEQKISNGQTIAKD